MIYLIIFIFGTLIGSFLNVVILRYNTGKNILALDNRSMCFSCGKQLYWYELIPVFSFLLQRARCRGCGSKISWQYPLVELATGLMFVAIFTKNFNTLFDPNNIASFALVSLAHFVIWSLLIVITVYDLRHKIIPDGLVFSFIGLTLLLAWFFPANAYSGNTFLSSVLAAAGLFAFFGGLWFVSGGRWLGFGDAKLVVGVGLLLGVSGGLSALAIAFWVGAGVSILIIFGGRLLNFLGHIEYISKVIRESRLRAQLSLLTMKSEIPFAPFIILGTLIAFFCQIDIFKASAFTVLF